MDNIQISGDTLLAAQLLALPAKVRAAVETKAMRNVNKIVLRAMRDETPRDSGALRRSMTSVVRNYGNGNVILGLTGPDKDFTGYEQRTETGKKRFKRGAKDDNRHGGGKRGFKRPAKYIHLVIGGTKKRETKSGANRGAVTPNPFIARITATIQSEIQQAFADAITEAIS